MKLGRVVSAVGVQNVTGSLAVSGPGSTSASPQVNLDMSTVHHGDTTCSNMLLVEYSDSESSESSSPEELESKSKGRQGVKRKRGSTSILPPLPDTFHDLYASASRVSNQDDPSLHGGRERMMPHVEGNWPTHIYIECKSILRKRSATRRLRYFLMETRVPINRTIWSARKIFDRYQPRPVTRHTKGAQSVEE